MYNRLIVDDEPIVKIALRSILPWEEYGFFICGTAGNGLEALSLVEKQHPDVIITDLKMPGMDGLELIRTLKEKKYPGEILVLSNYEDFDSVRSALLLGAADYLLKIKIQADNLLACLNKTTEKLQKKAAKCGFRWESAAECLGKLEEETAELREAIEEGIDPSEELGDMLFAAVNVAAFLQKDPEQVLHDACEKFIRRFGAMESAARQAGRSLDSLSREELLSLWSQQKTKE